MAFFRGAPCLSFTIHARRFIFLCSGNDEWRIWKRLNAFLCLNDCSILLPSFYWVTPCRSEITVSLCASVPPWFKNLTQKIIYLYMWIATEYKRCFSHAILFWCKQANRGCVVYAAPFFFSSFSGTRLRCHLVNLQTSSWRHF